MAKQDFFKGFDTSIPINWGNGIVEPLQAAIDRTTAFRQAARGNSNRATRLKNASPMLDRVKFRSRSLDDLFSLYMPFSTIVDTDKGNVAIDPSTTIPEGVRSYFNSFYYDFNNSGIMGDIIDGVKDKFAYNVCLYVSDDATKLMEMYEVLAIEPLDVCFFVEDNNGDQDSPQYLSCKIGIDVAENLIDVEKNLFTNTNIATYINSVLPTNNIESLSQEDLTKLLRYGKLPNITLDGIDLTLKVISITHTFDYLLFKMMANGFSWLIDQLEAQKFTAKDWNPKDNDGNTIKDFKPALIPIAMESLDFLNASSEDSNLSNFINTLEQNLDNFYTNARARLVAYDLGVVTYSQRQIDLIPDSLESNCKGVLLRNLDNIYPNIKALLQQLHNTDLGSLIGLGAGAANAFFCGILNSLIDALNGLLWIFKLGSQLAVKLQEIRLDFRDTFLKFLEYIDSLRKAIQAFDFGKIWKALLQHIKHFIQELPQASIYELSYFAGAAVGFIITIVVEIVLGLLLTGGAITVAIIVEELLKIVRSTAQFARKVSSTAAELLKNAGKIATSTMQKALTQLLRFFQQGTDNILKILDDFFSALRKGGDEVVDVISRLFNDVAKGIAKSKGDLNKTFFENAGKKVSKYVTSTRLLGQTTDHTCVAASLRMVLKDKAIIRSEEELARVLKTDINGARLMDIPEALYQKRLDEQVSAIFEKNIKLPKLIEKLQEGDMAIVSVFDEGIGSHAMVLEKIEDGKVFLKDPLPIKKGASYSVSIDDFEKIFKENAVIIKK